MVHPTTSPDYETTIHENTTLLRNDTVVNVTITLDITFDYFGTPLTVIFGALLICSMLLATFGNLLVIIVIFKNRRMRDDSCKTNLFLFNLAVADFFVGVFMIPFSFITLIHESWIFPKWFCTFNSFLNTVCFLTSIHTLMYIAIYKYICLSRISYHFSSKKCYLMIMAAWTWGLIFAILTTVGLGKATYKPKTMQCGPPYPEVEFKTYILHVLNQTFNLIIPFGIMTFAYIKIFKMIKEGNEFRRKNSICERDNRQVRDNGVSCTLFIVLICFLLCWLPYLFYINFATLIKDKNDIPVFLNPLAYCFGYMNSACNPVIYAWRFPDFRRGYRDILCSCKKPEFIVSRGLDGRVIIRPRTSSASNVTYNPRKSVSSNVISEKRISVISGTTSEPRKSLTPTTFSYNSQKNYGINGMDIGQEVTVNDSSYSRDCKKSPKTGKCQTDFKTRTPLTSGNTDITLADSKIVLSAEELKDIDNEVFMNNAV